MIVFNPDVKVVVTGAASGIGRAVSLLLNQLSASVIAVDRNNDGLKKLQNDAAFPENIFTEICDLVSDIAALPGFVTNLKEKYGK